ncbi:DUF2808 domain-containing protein [Leptolyngbya iicbica]|uniref:DUF2808 domain-containing protein n=2 Tax=Cyanophyceae TaxID=3028117 RepID=A0A4Q7EFQ1_9CYAN|nr:DUF2808 domain-containing protein [Leptolyngbya sp. LK]RZM81907.1 DUF2808 domain-containing protein [Leptolyngbya sp. LK]
MKLGKPRRRGRSRLALALASITCIATVVLPLGPTAAVQLGDGTTVFTSPPRLADFVTLDNDTYDRRPTYYVTVNLPPDAEEPLETLTVSLIEGRFTRLNYRTQDIEVFTGTRRDRGASYDIATADYDADSQTLTVQLAEPAEPGQLLTFALTLVRNPRWEGVYLYEVTAAPAGEKPQFQRVGTGRIHIYQRDFIFFD